MLKAKRAPLVLSLCLILCLIGMALFTILMQSRAQTGALWAGRAADLYALSLDTRHSPNERAQILGRSREAMLEGLQNDPYNAAHWLRFSVINTYYSTMSESVPDGATPYNPATDIITRLKPDTSLRGDDYIVPSAPPAPSVEPD